jgi:uncharacterized membrane protein
MADRITKSIRVNAPIKKVYQTWARFENFPLFMENIKSIRMIGPRTSLWEAEGPLGSNISWKAETVDMQEEKQIEWRSIEDEDINLQTNGIVTFTPVTSDSTLVTVSIQYSAAGSAAAEALAKIFSNPEKQLQQDLENFKVLVEDDENPKVSKNKE